MLFRIVEIEGEYHLLLSTGKIRYLSFEEIKTFLNEFEHFKNNEHNESSDIIGKYQGKTVAELNKKGQLVFHDLDFLRKLMNPTDFPYYTVAEYADACDKSIPMILRYCRENRIEGIIRKANSWFIPKGAPYPEDNRVGRDTPKDKLR